MQERCTTKMRKGQSMKFLCIISGCPAGARKWHISCFAMLLHSKIARLPTQAPLWVTDALCTDYCKDVVSLPGDEPSNSCWNWLFQEGGIQVISLFGCPKTIDITVFFEKCCITTRTTSEQSKLCSVFLCIKNIRLLTADVFIPFRERLYFIPCNIAVRNGNIIFL